VTSCISDYKVKEVWIENKQAKLIFYDNYEKPLSTKLPPGSFINGVIVRVDNDAGELIQARPAGHYDHYPCNNKQLEAFNNHG